MISVPCHSQGVEDEGVSQRESGRIGDNLVGIVNQRVVRDAPAFVPNDALTVFARRLQMIPVAVILIRLSALRHALSPALSPTRVAELPFDARKLLSHQIVRKCRRRAIGRLSRQDVISVTPIFLRVRCDMPRKTRLALRPQTLRRKCVSRTMCSRPLKQQQPAFWSHICTGSGH